MEYIYRLNKLTKLQNGWLDGEGKAPNTDGIRWLKKRMIENFDTVVSTHVYPTPEGGVQLEWDFGHFRPTLEIDLENHAGIWHCLDLETGEDKERYLNLADKHCWGWLVTELRNMQA